MRLHWRLYARAGDTETRQAQLHAAPYGLHLPADERADVPEPNVSAEEPVLSEAGGCRRNGWPAMTYAAALALTIFAGFVAANWILL